MDNIELEDLVYTYPSIKKKGFQTKTSAKEEFREVGALITEPVPERGGLFRQQKFIKRYMKQYDNILITAEPGVGKTCAVLSVSEHYKVLADVIRDTLKDETIPYNRVIALVKGQSLIDEWKFQLVCKCTAGDYITEQILNSKTESQRKANVTRSVSRFYTFSTYETFAKTLLQLNDEQLRNEFDNTIFIVDEVHNINKDTSQGTLRKDPITGNEYYVNFKKDKRTGEQVEVTNTSRLIYDQLWRLFHTVHPRKVMLLSATPMINDVSEIGPRLNLILPRNKQLPDNIDFNKITLQQFEPYLRGLVSFVRALDTGAIPVYQGKIIDATYDIGGKKTPAQMKIYATEMSGKQAETYQLALDDPLALRPESEKPEAFADLQRQAANFVFPDGSTGTVGYKKYVTEEKGVYKANDELYRWLSSDQHFRTLSAKFYEIVRLCKKDPGNCWCYSNYIRGSGAIVLGLCFEAQGFERFSELTSIFGGVMGGGLAPLCGGKEIGEEKGNRFIRIPKKLRYALLTSETSGPETAAILEAFNSYENRHGEYIKAVIGSPVTRDGLNLANALQIHLTGPGWNQASTYQAISRAIRSTSHVDLLEEERQKYIREGKDPDQAYVDIKVYRHAAVKNGKSIDVEMYQISEKKDRQIKRVFRIMKQCAVDCQINYNRNVRPTDVDGSATCDYDICQYKCVDPEPTEIDYTSFDVLYSGDIIDAAKQEIKDIFRVTFRITLSDLYLELKEYRRKFIDMAVTHLVANKEVVVDRYGYNSYLREDGGDLFLVREYPVSIIEKPGNVLLSSYTETLIGILSLSLKEYIGVISQSEQSDIFRQLSRMEPASEQFNETIDKLSLDNKIRLVEEAVYKYGIEKNTSPYIEAIITKFKPYLFSSLEPIGALDISKEALKNRGKGRGRKPRPGTKFKLRKEQQQDVEDALDKLGKDEIYFHNLSTATEALTSYAVTAKNRKIEGKIRLIKPSEGIWRDANEYEDPVYNTIIKLKLDQEKKNLERQFDIYGTIMDDGKFRIIDKTTEDVELSSVDTRKVNRGRVCSSWQKSDIFEILKKLNINPFTIDIDLDKDELIDYLVKVKFRKRSDLEKLKLKDLKFYYTWYTSGMGRKNICTLLKDELDKMGRLIKL